MKRWIELSVRRPIGVIMLVIAILVLGYVSLGKLSIDLYPEIKAPIGLVAVSYPGAAPEDVEKMVIKPLEGSLGTLEGLTSLRSQASTGSAILILEFDWGTNMESKSLEIREKVDAVKGLLPKEADEPRVLKFDLQAIPIMQLSVSGSTDLVRLTQIAENQIQPFLERTTGVASVTVNGIRKKEVVVEVDPVKLQQYHLSLTQISQVLSGENLSMTAGNLSKGSQELSLRIIGEYRSVEDIRKLLIPTPMGKSIPLEEIASVKEQLAKETAITKVNGTPSLSIDLMKKSGGNTVEVSDAILKTLNQIRPTLPEGVKVDVVYDLSTYIKASIRNVNDNMIMGGVLAVIVLYLFLRNFRSTFVIALSLPFSIVSTFLLLYFYGENLNMLTLGGLALGIGMMTDSSIVILENIFKKREQNVEIKEAAITGAGEVAGAVIASALTSMAVFLPIVFVSGLAGELFRPLAITVSFSNFAALVVALTLVPSLAGLLLKKVKPIASMDRPKLFGWPSYLAAKGLDQLTGVYKRVIRFALRHRLAVLLLSFLLVIASFALIPFIGTEFMPASDQGEINVDVELPWGTLLSETNRVVDDLAAKIGKIPEVKTIFTTAGGGGTFSMSPSSNSHLGNLYVQLTPLAERKRTTAEVMEEIRGLGKTYPDATVTVSDIQSGGFGQGTSIQIQLKGNELPVLADLSSSITKMIGEIPGIRNVKSTAEENKPELEIRVDRNLMDQYGVSFAQVMNEVRAAVDGQLATRYRVNGEEIDVRVTLPEEAKNDLAKVENLPVPTTQGGYLPLSAVAKLVEGEIPAQINRENQSRTVEITADLFGVDLGKVTAEIQKKLSTLQMPEGYSYTMGGQYEQMMDSFSQLALALVLAVFLVYLVMAVQFEAITYPLVIMFSMPATVIGVVLGLVITGRTFSVPAFIGLIILAGIVVNNAIVLVDYVNLLRSRGMEREEALVEGGSSRLRPILMTTLTTILGMLPLSLGIGEGSESQAPLATVVIFGLTTSTLVTLVLIPVVYTYFDGLETSIKNLGKRRKRGKIEEQSVEA